MKKKKKDPTEQINYPPNLNLMPQAFLPEEKRYCPECKKLTMQKLLLFDPDNMDSELIWTCNDCNEGNDFFCDYD